jgi:uncharacterized membrane protein YukC
VSAFEWIAIGIAALCVLGCAYLAYDLFWPWHVHRKGPKS